MLVAILHPDLGEKRGGAADTQHQFLHNTLKFVSLTKFYMQSIVDRFILKYIYPLGNRSFGIITIEITSLNEET